MAVTMTEHEAFTFLWFTLNQRLESLRHPHCNCPDCPKHPWDHLTVEERVNIGHEAVRAGMAVMESAKEKV